MKTLILGCRNSLLRRRFLWIPKEDPDELRQVILSLPPPLAVNAISSILHSLRRPSPGCPPHPILSSLLTLLLPNPTTIPESIPTVHFPLSLAVLQSFFRSGLPPPPCTRSSLSDLYIHLRRRHHLVPVFQLLQSVNDIDFRFDSKTCDYLISALCCTGEVEEAARVLRGLRRAGGMPDSESSWKVVERFCESRNFELGLELMRFMVVEEGMVLKKGMVGRLVKAMRKIREVRKAVEAVRWLEREGCEVEFDGYARVVEGCLENKEFVLAGKVFAEMTKRGFVPFAKVRRKVFDGLAGIEQHELAGNVRSLLSDIGS